MYTPEKFKVDESQAWRIVREAGAGLLVRGGASGLASVFVPVVVDEEGRTLTTHLAKANDFWRDLHDGDEVLAFFLAASAYVSPSFYPSRLEGANHVPTWNYVATEVRATVRLHTDADWLHHQTGEVTDAFEAERDPAWSTAETDPAYLAKQYAAIVGLTLSVTSIEGKAKLSQNRLDEDRAEVEAQLRTGGEAEQLTARWMRGE
jgi:transcriptional regulator